MGIRSTNLNLIKSYITDGKQRVKLEDVISDYDVIKHGVPQGTVFGPTLFLAYMNDFIKITAESSLTCYTDDTVLVRIIE